MVLSPKTCHGVVTKDLSWCCHQELVMVLSSRSCHGVVIKDLPWSCHQELAMELLSRSCHGVAIKDLSLYCHQAPVMCCLFVQVGLLRHCVVTSFLLDMFCHEMAIVSWPGRVEFYILG